MKLHQLFSYFGNLAPNTTASVTLEEEVTSVCFDTREVRPGSVFVAIRGNEKDGHNFLEQAISSGAIALVVENKSRVPADYPHVVVEVADSREILDILATRFYNFPSQDLFCIGVTGTNGKTSITYILEHILNFHRKPVGVMGTVNHRVGSKIWPNKGTTPDPVTLQQRLRDFANAGAEVVAIEVTSHALDQKRAHSVHFNTVIFTNLTHDHLDYHKTMADYFAAKQRLFTDLMWLTSKFPKFAVVNIDDSYGRRLRVADEVVAWTYGQKECDFQFKILKMNFNETEFEIKTALATHKTCLPISGEHTVSNIVAGCVAAISAGISLEQSLQALKSFEGVPGRLQKVDSQSQKTVFVDYAHTPDALENVLQSLQNIRKNSNSLSRIICVFGCGGDRDRTKRPLMAEISARLSDYTIITSDNPRTEAPLLIIEDIKKGLPGNHAHSFVEADRELAIKKAIEISKDDDVILIAGKGHEDYQIIGTEQKYFSDLEVAKKHLRMT